MHPSQRLLVQLALVAAVWQPGCAAKLAITSLEPSPLFLGPNRDLVIVGGEGNRYTREHVYRELVEQARRVGYFQVTDLSREGFQTRTEDSRVRLETFDRPLAETEIGLWIDVNKQQLEGSARVTLTITAFGPKGDALVDRHRLDGVSEVGSEVAATDAVRAFLEQITPSEVTRFVPLDEDDAGQIPILEVALDGNIARAREDMKAYVDNEPDNASAVYNLAVLTEAMGKLRDALDLYDRALRISSKELYSESRAAAARYADLDNVDELESN